ncbi:hypothetical protein COO60DRAFT_149034 [Scenedesmus sp. NREL 46B-D3]|nr:hypothetical protein COO60DRAFT_149034 [Scenedesmus sp. NREL 46B-D3]
MCDLQHTKQMESTLWLLLLPYSSSEPLWQNSGMVKTTADVGTSDTCCQKQSEMLHKTEKRPARAQWPDVLLQAQTGLPRKRLNRQCHSQQDNGARTPRHSLRDDLQRPQTLHAACAVRRQDLNLCCRPCFQALLQANCHKSTTAMPVRQRKQSNSAKPEPIAPQQLVWPPHSSACCHNTSRCMRVYFVVLSACPYHLLPGCQTCSQLLCCHIHLCSHTS